MELFAQTTKQRRIGRVGILLCLLSSEVTKKKYFFIFAYQIDLLFSRHENA